MNVAQVARRYLKRLWGGTETVLAESLKRLPALGVHSEIWCTSAFSKPGAELVENIRVRRFQHYYPYLGLSPEARVALDQKGGSCVSPSMIWHMLRDRQVDLMHLHTGNRIGAGVRAVARWRKIPYVVTLHGGQFDMTTQQRQDLSRPTQGAWDLGKPLGWLLGSRRIIKDAAAIICVGYNEYLLARDRLDQQVEFLPNGVDTARFRYGSPGAFRQELQVQPEDFVVLLVGRWDPQKGQAEVLRVWPAIRAANPRLQLALVGEASDADYGARVESLATGQAGVHLLGPLPAGSPALINAYHGADLVLIPSHYEPLGIVALEAWASGTPVLARRVGGLQHLIRDGQDGLLFDHDRELPGLLCELCGRPELLSELAGTGLASVQSYDWDHFARRTAALYQRLIPKMTRSRSSG